SPSGRRPPPPPPEAQGSFGMPSFRCSRCNTELPTDAQGDPQDCPACGAHSPVLDMHFPAVGPRPKHGITALEGKPPPPGPPPPAPRPAAARGARGAPPAPPPGAVRRGPLPPEVPGAEAIRGGPPAPLRLLPEDDTVDDQAEGSAFVDDLMEEARVGRRRR